MDVSQELMLLKKRAKAFSVPLAQEERGEQLAVIRFLLYPETFAIPVASVHEVFSLRDLTVIPGTPEFVLGVMNYRSTIVPVVNLKKLLGIREAGLTEMNKVLLLRNDNMEFGLLCDRILESGFILQDEIQEPPASLSKLGLEFIKGMAGPQTILLDGEALLNSRRLIVDA
ncbi:CheW protein [Cyclonatronum proteinivorum]|uniref:CheW protein n=2 Tax=Cyclonatronum proteinivorum TaxID=1457365 RepID=A0A345UKZ7_9BACT|nr:CheW protein [Cyclonatronum proteinivorum]